jgi:pimeloyl-ACP methyl ester carboxylesterase
MFERPVGGRIFIERFRMPTLTINGATMSYAQHGDEHAPAVVLLHGFPLNGRMWRPQVEALAGRYRVIVPDFRGFGASGETGPFSIEQLADDVYALAQSLKLGAFVLVGLSMGGYVAIAYAKKYPATLRGLILLDTKAEADTPETKAGRDKSIATVREKGASAIADAMLPRLVPPEVIEHRPALARELRQMMEGTRVSTIEHALAAMRDRPDTSDALPSFAMPALVIVGEKDGITPPDVTGAMAARIPRATHVVIAGAGHMSNMEQPAQVNGAMESFVRGL